MQLKRVRNPLMAAIACLTVVAAGCASSGSTNAGGSGAGASGATQIIKLGLLTSVTGPYSGHFGDATVKAAQARVALANAEHEVPGVTFKLVVQDDQSSPEGSLAATKILIDREKVFAIVDASSTFSADYKYTVQKNVPVLGWEDGTEFADPNNKNLFSYWGSPSTDKPAIKNVGQYFNSRGATTACRIATAEVPAAVTGADQFAASAESLGIKIAYKTNVSVTVPDMGPTALAVQKAGCDSLVTILPSNQEVNLMQNLHDLGVHVKANFGPSYGAAVLQKASAAANNGLDFLSQYQPYWMKTAASERVRNAMATYAGVDTPTDGAPASGMFWGWVPTDLAIAGVKVAGNASATPDSFIEKLRGVTDYNAGGYICPVDFTKSNNVIAGTYSACIYMSRIQDGKFVAPAGLQQPIDLLH
jgi:branched-chain amino acid transport system substrate-binding protein